ncbi:Glycine amidinotransferase [Phytophthora fragariae]|uniref:Glycine amidinotransferase, mitochondrial n=1 Tax=Phytophthora fragariae TaxID=53985 RepID=A0A6A3U9T8_9STRA|nr:Glycine amidinotransferase [Phytophthora fragariae]KAE9014093.1 Glycine amidinotransferase [Phytophthora fragariae]KAE9117437.1 Glycine amidinotransferase [Phytophthora fragariae]KAE9148024.1 Glycine amidinotransferase [Phytophthora fragariae]KAE9228259.1 Glycine amidinotransferase [Phytophthora fragariae]
MSVLLRSTTTAARAQLLKAAATRGFAAAATATGTPIINSHNEWDPLEEVIVGRVEGATIPEWHVSGKAVWPNKHWDMYKTKAGLPFPKELMEGAAKELDYLAEVLEGEGVIVRRPEAATNDFNQPIKTPDFSSRSQLYAAMPRDVLIVFGNEIVEAPMAWRSRYFEFRPYRKLIKEYFQKGGKWTAAPKPQMSDELYNEDWKAESGVFNSVVTEFEPTFDAAEFTRMGRDIFTQQSQVTNQFGIEWVRRHLGDDYNVHVLDFQDRNAMHIDGTFVPLMPGKLLANPFRPCITGRPVKTYSYKDKDYQYCLPEMFKGWEVFVAPEPELSKDHPLFFTSPWTATCNVLVVRPGTVVVEAHEKKAQQCFKDWGFEVIPVPFRNFMPFGGSFHCATCDGGEIRDGTGGSERTGKRSRPCARATAASRCHYATGRCSSAALRGRARST